MRITFRPGGTALCPLCKEALSREAKKCPHCQSDLTDNAEWKAIQQSKGGCMPLVLVVLLILSWYAFAGGITTATETFTDSTCDAISVRDVTLLETLPAKLQKKPK